MTSLKLCSLVALSGLLACAKEPSLVVGFGPAPRDFAFTITTGCNLSADENACRELPASGGDVELSADDGAGTNLRCTFSVRIQDACPVDPLIAPLALLQATVADVPVYDSASPTRVDIGAADFLRVFDDDNDGYSNYLEWAEGSDPRDSTARPAGAPDL